MIEGSPLCWSARTEHGGNPEERMVLCSGLTAPLFSSKIQELRLVKKDMFFSAYSLGIEVLDSKPLG